MHPKNWGGVQRDAHRSTQLVKCEKDQATLEQCTYAKGLWKVKMANCIVGCVLTYVDDVLIMAPTKWILSVFETDKQLFGVTWAKLLESGRKDHQINDAVSYTHLTLPTTSRV